jgi:hypothetical protein
VDAGYRASKTEGSLLNLACEARFVKMVRYLLEVEGGGKIADEEVVRDRSAALYKLVESTACKGAFVKRELLEDVYQIASMLVLHGADPGLVVEGKTKSTRDVASRHPDPRVRNMLSRAMPVVKTREVKSAIGLSKLDSCTSKPVDITLLDPSLGYTRYATLADFLDRSDSYASGSTNEDGGHFSHTSDLVHLVASDMRGLAQRPEDFLDFSTFSSFRQFGNPKTAVGAADRGIWAQIPAPVKTAPEKLAIEKADVQTSAPKRVDVEEATMLDPFPQLAQPVEGLDGPYKELWADFSMMAVAEGMKETQRMMPVVEEVPKQTTGRKNAKRKQWVALQL